MNKLMKILAFTILLVVIVMFTGTVSASNSAKIPENGIQSINKALDDNVDWNTIDYGCPSQGDNCSG
ncbi:MAG TPA: hypothetical protein VHO92_10720, partial [Methanobacterium sp.]|nr:hypothetical protein [Methanobacterium sp.]